jgi:hypothetical protein
MEKKETTRAPFYKLRELAPRALMILERYKQVDPALALFEATLVPVATEFIASFDGTHSFQMRRPLKATAQERAVNHVWVRMNVWLAFLARDIRSFDRREYDVDVDSAVQVIAAAERLLAFVVGRTEEEPALAYVTQLAADLTEGLQIAQRDWIGARTSLNEQQVMQAETRKLAFAFERELHAFHDVLGTIVGESNTDYQSLRVIRRSKTDNRQEAESRPATPLPNGADPHPEVGSQH